MASTSNDKSNSSNNSVPFDIYNEDHDLGCMMVSVKQKKKAAKKKTPNLVQPTLLVVLEHPWQMENMIRFASSKLIIQAPTVAKVNSQVKEGFVQKRKASPPEGRVKK
ncbi:hypothetical protein ACH5RR_006617 [Cinchona calisaya]|uniref:Uncharacterized protein n=1 Tax=Cinchona calisaya TaxID=153742 RepID=A0ABD3APJ7_9GENT